MAARRLELGRVEEEVPPQVEQVAKGDKVPIGGQGVKRFRWFPWT